MNNTAGNGAMPGRPVLVLAARESGPSIGDGEPITGSVTSILILFAPLAHLLLRQARLPPLMTMTHDQIEVQDLIDRYLRGTLDAPTAEAFEEHYFDCDICSAKVTELEALRGAERAAVADGTLSVDAASLSAPVVPPAGTSITHAWLPLAASVTLAAGLGWMALVEMPSLRKQLVTVSADRDLLRSALDSAKAATPRTAVALEANVPMVILTSDRAAGDIPLVTLTSSATHFLVVVDGPSSPSGTAQLSISANGAAEVTTIGGLTRGTNGVWTVSLPNQSYPDAMYRLRLRDDAPNGALLGDYLMKITRVQQ